MDNKSLKPSLPRTHIYVPTDKNEILKTAVERINDNIEIRTLWNVINVNAINRLGMTDHGPVHFQIVANIGLRLFRILVKNNITPSVVKDFGLTLDHAELVVVLGCLLHDLGMSINRDGHEEFSLFLANHLLHKLLDFLPVEERVIITSEVLHAIISHRSGGRPITLEAGVVRVADALDMSEGRSRVPYEAGKVNIHSVSAVAIERVEIQEGKEKPVQINIEMNNSAGIFQVDELLKSKLNGSGIEQYFEIKAYIKDKTEKSLIKEFYIKQVE